MHCSNAPTTRCSHWNRLIARNCPSINPPDLAEMSMRADVPLRGGRAVAAARTQLPHGRASRAVEARLTACPDTEFNITFIVRNWGHKHFCKLFNRGIMSWGCFTCCRLQCCNRTLVVTNANQYMCAPLPFKSINTSKPTPSIIAAMCMESRPNTPISVH